MEASSIVTAGTEGGTTMQISISPYPACPRQFFLLRVHTAPAGFSSGWHFSRPRNHLLSGVRTASLRAAGSVFLHLSSRASCSSTARRIHAVRHQPASPHIRVAGNTQFPGQFCSSSHFGIRISSVAAELRAGGLSASDASVQPKSRHHYIPVRWPGM